MIKKALFSLFVLSFLVAPLALNAQSADDIAQLIAKLEQQIAYLKQQLAHLQGQQSGQWCFTFEKNLGVGSGGKDVDALHAVLVKEGFTISPMPVSASTGTSYEIEFKKSKVSFTEATAAAVSGFQLKYAKEILAPLGLANPTGYVGPATRAVLNRLYGCKYVIQPPYPPTMPTPIPPKISDLRVDSPNGGEAWQKGTTQRIGWSWQTDAFAGQQFTIYLTPVNWSPTNPQLVIATGIAGTSYYDWAVGKAKNLVTGENIAPSQSYYVAICAPSNFGGRVCDQSDSYFKIYDQDTPPIPGNLPPTISGVSGPTTLKIGETGTWTVQASDPENGPLSYSVVWGDETMVSGGVAAPTMEKVQQTATFTHSYAQAGTYYPKFKVTDNAGQSNSTSISVTVGSGIVTTPAPGLDFEVMSFELNSNGPFVRFCNRGTYSVNSFPVWIMINGVTREFNMQGHWEPLVNCGLSHQWYYATWGFNAMPSSSYEGKVIVDPKNVYAETNENNNEAKANYDQPVTVEPSIKITSPVSGETWKTPTFPHHELRWVTGGIPSGNKITIKLFNNSGQIVNSIIIGVDNTGYYPYNLFNAPTGWYYIELSTQVDGKTISTKSSLFYVLNVSEPSTAQVLSPNGGETLEKGKKYIISWGATGAPEVSVYLIRDSDPAYRLAIRHNFVSGRANSIEWTVPGGDTATSDIAAGSDYRIWVIGGGATAVDDKSDRPFTITTTTATP